MAKKTKKKTASKNWNVWIDGQPKHDYPKGRDKIEAACGESSGSGSGFGGWDTSYHNITKAQAMSVAKKATPLRCVKRVRVYEDSDVRGGTYLKGKKEKGE